MDNRSIDKFDLRLRRRFEENKDLSADEIKSYTESLEDQSDNIEEIVIEDENVTEE
ncbi:hypothetical protein CL651_001925 [bacterium]|nr:hypothetical protein [bacterium]|tara:strand:- start:14107 stop:14274 length:168 start_codon:yes stop_codon:yes gene_type:complete